MGPLRSLEPMFSTSAGFQQLLTDYIRAAHFEEGSSSCFLDPLAPSFGARVPKPWISPLSLTISPNILSHGEWSPSQGFSCTLTLEPAFCSSSSSELWADLLIPLSFPTHAILIQMWITSCLVYSNALLILQPCAIYWSSERHFHHIIPCHRVFQWPPVFCRIKSRSLGLGGTQASP